MEIIKTPLEGFYVIKPTVYEDDRGLFLETYQEDRYKRFGINDDFVQDNQSRSKYGVIRGLHFTVKKPQAQLITILRGRIFDVGVDIRPESPTFGEWYGIELSDTGIRQIYQAPGFAHGFCVLSEWVDLHYKVTQYYDHSDEGGIHWNDSDLNIDWPILNPEISMRDEGFSKFKELTVDKLPHLRTTEKIINYE